MRNRLAIRALSLPAVVVAALLFGLAPAARAAGELPPPGPISGYLDKPVDTGLTFTDHKAAQVTLGDYLSDGEPVLLTLNYYRCTSLCSLQLNGFVRGLRELGRQAGDGYRIVTVSIAPTEGPELASGKRDGYLGMLGDEDADWSFLTGTEDNIRALASQLGFTYVYDEKSGEYAHPAVVYALDASGVLKSFLYGVELPGHELRLALAAAGAGDPLAPLLGLVFRYDQDLGRYQPALGGIVAVSAAGGLLLALPFVLLARRKLRALEVPPGPPAEA